MAINVYYFRFKTLKIWFLAFEEIVVNIFLTITIYVLEEQLSSLINKQK